MSAHLQTNFANQRCKVTTFILNCKIMADFFEKADSSVARSLFCVKIVGTWRAASLQYSVE